MCQELKNRMTEESRKLSMILLQFIRDFNGISRASTNGGIYRPNSDEKWVVEWNLDTGNASAHNNHVTVDGHLIAVGERGDLLINKG